MKSFNFYSSSKTMSCVSLLVNDTKYWKSSLGILLSLR